MFETSSAPLGPPLRTLMSAPNRRTRRRSPPARRTARDPSSPATSRIMVIGVRMGATWRAVERQAAPGLPGEAAVTMPGPVRCPAATPLDDPPSGAGFIDGGPTAPCAAQRPPDTAAAPAAPAPRDPSRSSRALALLMIVDLDSPLTVGAHFYDVGPGRNRRHGRVPTLDLQLRHDEHLRNARLRVDEVDVEVAGGTLHGGDEGVRDRDLPLVVVMGRESV